MQDFETYQTKRSTRNISFLFIWFLFHFIYVFIYFLFCSVIWGWIFQWMTQMSHVPFEIEHLLFIMVGWTAMKFVFHYTRLTINLPEVFGFHSEWKRCNISVWHFDEWKSARMSKSVWTFKVIFCRSTKSETYVTANKTRQTTVSKRTIWQPLTAMQNCI